MRLPSHSPFRRPPFGVLATTGQQTALGAKDYSDFVTAQGGVNSAKIRTLAADGLSISQAVPCPSQQRLPVAGQFQEQLAKYAPGASVNSTNFDGYPGARVPVEGLKRAGANPTRERLFKALESMTSFDLGGITVGYGPKQRVGSRFADVTVIDGSGKPLK